jgi:type VI secretion system protein VasJ
MLLADTSRAWAYRLHRQAIWQRYEALAVEGVEGPDAAQLALPGDLAATGRWQELAVAGEEQSARSPLWLDPHRFVALALEHMGSAFVDAREAVGRDTSDFVRRNAWLLEAKFSEGIPLASPETVEWLQAESNRWQRGFTSRAMELAKDEEKELADRFSEAKNLVAAGRHVEGLAIAIQLARGGADTRERFRFSIKVAALAMNAGAHEVARPILEGLVATATAHSLETWDPSLCAQLYAGLYRCLPLDAPDRSKVFEVLCRLDPGQALRAQGAAAGGPPVRPVAAAPRVAPIAATPVTSAQPTAGAAPAPAPKPEPEAPLKVMTNSDSEWFDDD